MPLYFGSVINSQCLACDITLLCLSKFDDLNYVMQLIKTYPTYSKVKYTIYSKVAELFAHNIENIDLLMWLKM